MDWTLEDNVVDGLFCATQAVGGGQAPFVQEGVEAVKPEPRCSWQGHFGRACAGIGDKSMEPRTVIQPLRIAWGIRPVHRTCVVR